MTGNCFLNLQWPTRRCFGSLVSPFFSFLYASCSCHFFVEAFQVLTFKGKRMHVGKQSLSDSSITTKCYLLWQSSKWEYLPNIHCMFLIYYYYYYYYYWFFETNSLLWCIYVCVCVCRLLCVQVYVYVCGGQETTLGTVPWGLLYQLLFYKKATVIKHQDQGNSKKKEFLWACGSLGIKVHHGRKT